MIMDYQLFEFQYLHDLSNFSEQKNGPLTDTNEDEDPPIVDFYNFIENKTENKINLKNYLRHNFNKVRVISRYPSVIGLYSKVFKKYNEDLLSSGLLDLKIRDYINYFFYNEKRTQKNSIDINDPRKRFWGPIFEDILNLYIKENKTSKLIVIPEELRFLDDWEVQKYFDAVSNKSETEIKADKNVSHKKDETMLFSNYPPRRKEFLAAVIQGLSFINYSQDEETIDGGFVYSRTELLEDYKDRQLKRPEHLISTSEAKNFINKLDIITFDATIKDKTELFYDDKFKRIKNNLEKVCENCLKLVNQENKVYTAKYNFIKHYLIVLENTSNNIINSFILFK